MAARLLALLVFGFSAAVAMAAEPKPLLPTPEELAAAKTLSARQLLYCERLAKVRRDEADIVSALYGVGMVSKDEADAAAKRLKAAEEQLAQVKGGKAWQRAKEAAPASYDDALARLTREEEIAKNRVDAGIAPTSALAEARRQRLRLQWTFGPKDNRADVAAEMAKALRELLDVSAALRREGLNSSIDELDVRRELVVILPPAEAAAERQAFVDHARKAVAILQARQEAAVISNYEVYRGAASAIEALLSLETE